MKNYKITLLNYILSICMLITCCETPENQEKSGNWSIIIKDLEIILASASSDSIKAVKIKTLFDSNGVSLTDYRNFYEESLEKNPKKNLGSLKEIEQLISKDMKAEAQRQKKIGTNIDYRPGKKEDLKK